MKGAAFLAIVNLMPQIISFFSTPFLSRLYNATDFGDYYFVFSLATVFSIVISGTLNNSILATKRNSEAIVLYRELITITWLLFFILIAIVVVLYFFEYRFFLLIAEVAGLSVALALSMHLSALIIRLGDFKKIAIYGVVKASSVAVTQIVLVLVGFSEKGLMVGALASEFFCYLVFSSRYRTAKLVSFNLVKRELNYVYYYMPSQLIALSANLIPVVFLKGIGGVDALGMYSMLVRLISTPVNACANGIKPLYWRWLSESKAEKLKVAFAFAGIVFALSVCSSLFYWFADITILGKYLGSGWENIDQYVPLVMIWMGGSVANLFFAELLKNNGKQKYLLLNELLSVGVKLCFLIFSIFSGIDSFLFVKYWLLIAIFANITNMLLLVMHIKANEYKF